MNDLTIPSLKEIIKILDNNSNCKVLLKEEKAAANYITKQHFELSKFITGTENKDVQDRIVRIKGNKKVNELNINELNLILPLLQIAASVENAKQELLDIKYLAAAFYFFINKKTERNVLKIIENRPWKFKHEVTIRLAWMRRQKELILQYGTKFNHPFLCNVGKLRNRRNIDREFFSIKTFILLYAKRIGRKYLFRSVANTSVPSLSRPDFILQDVKGGLLGIEITEVNIKPNSHFEDKSLEDFTLELSKIFRMKKFHLVLCSEPKWDLVNKDISKIIEWIEIEETKMQEILKKQDTYEIRNEFYNISLRFKKDSEFYSFAYAGRKIRGSIEEENLGISIRERIEKRLQKGKPIIRPCYLVIFMRTGIPFMNTKKVKQYAKKELGNKFKSHFDQIWAVKEQRILRIA